MGQYHYPVNLDRKEYLNPSTFGDGLKLMEFGMSSEGTMTGLALLLAVSNGRGGGDLHIWTPSTDDPRGMQPFGGTPTPRQQQVYDAILGRWGGNRIAIIGDYYEAGDLKDLDGSYTDGTGDLYKDLFPSWQDEAGEWQYGESDWLDISDIVLEAMRLDFYFNETWEKRIAAAQARGYSYTHGHTPVSDLDDEGNIVKVVKVADA